MTFSYSSADRLKAPALRFEIWLFFRQNAVRRDYLEGFRIFEH
jgi:hypothetical protein